MNVGYHFARFLGDEEKLEVKSGHFVIDIDGESAIITRSPHALMLQME